MDLFNRRPCVEEKGRKRDTKTKRLDRESLKRNEGVGAVDGQRAFTEKDRCKSSNGKNGRGTFGKGLGRFKLYIRTAFALLILAQIISLQPDGRHRSESPNFGCRVEIPSNFPSSCPVKPTRTRACTHIHTQAHNTCIHTQGLWRFDRTNLPKQGS